VSDGYAIKIKESDKIKISPFPTIANLKQWNTDTYTSVLAASGRSDSLVVTWLRKAEDPGVTFEQLGNTLMELITLDQKFSHALIGVCKGEFHRMVSLLHEARMQKESVPLAGPQILRMILEHFRTTQSMTTYNTVLDLGRIPWKGDQELQSWWNELNNILGEICDEVKDQTLVDILLSYFDMSPSLTNEARVFRRLDLGDASRTW